MAIEVISWVLQNSPVKNSQRLVLIAIANYADKSGGNAYPSVSTIARLTRLDERSVSIAISKLADNGHMKVDRSAGPRGVHRYAVVMDPPDPDKSPGGRITAPKNHRGTDGAEGAPTPEESPPREDTAPKDSAPTPEESPPEPSLNRSSNSPSVDGHVRSAQNPRGTTGKRGTRITRDFRPNAESVQRIRALGFSDVELRFHTDQFIDHWDGESGAKATKSNWNSAWCVWMRKERPGRGGGRNSPPVGRAEQGMDLAEQLRAEGR